MVLLSETRQLNSWVVLSLFRSLGRVPCLLSVPVHIDSRRNMQNMRVLAMTTCVGKWLFAEDKRPGAFLITDGRTMKQYPTTNLFPYVCVEAYTALQ